MKLRRQGGFTLVELIVVIALMALLTAMVMPTVQQTYHQLQMDIAIQQLHKDVRWAQRLAVQEQKQVVMNFLRSSPPSYKIRLTGVGQQKAVYMPNGSSYGSDVSTLYFNTDGTIKNSSGRRNGNILIQMGEIERYVYYYQTGRTRITTKQSYT